LLVASAVLAACGGEGGGGRVIIGMRSDFSGFNSITSSAQYTSEIINYALFTPLVHYNEDLGVEPRLAESWTLEGDTAITLRLRGDVRWHDGQPVTAQDVQFTFERAKAPESASLLGSAFLADVAAAEILDSLTIRFRFTRPHAQALEDFFWAPMPRHLLENITPAELRNAPFNRQPVGNGPFRFVEWRANELLVLERNPDYPESLGGPATAAGVVFRIIPEAATRTTELFTGGIHVNIDVTPDDVAAIKQQSAVATLQSFPGRTVYYVGWNNARAPFNDVRVRRALARAIDRKQIIDALLHGHGTLAESTIPPWHPLAPDEVTSPPFAADEAGRLLDEAGWRDRNNDGVRENAQGKPLRFTMISSDDPLRRASVEILQEQLRRAGADVEIRIMEFQTMRQQHQQRDFDVIFTNWVLDNFQVVSAPFALFHSSQAAVPLSANRSSVKIPRLDALIERGGSATQPEEQRQIWTEFTRLLQEEQPVTFMFWLDELAATSTRLEGVSMDPRGELRTIRDWSIGGR
jgi:peptide/nickel transport system substrate-binding protein